MDNKWTKACLLFGGCAFAGISAYSAYCYYQNINKMVDEGFEDIRVTDDSSKKILVFGLDGAGKSTFLSHLSKSEENFTDIGKEYNVSLKLESGTFLNFSKIGGSKEARIYWPNFAQDADILVYLVDSADEHRLAESVKELRILTACDTLRKLPIIVLANKQDLKNAGSLKDIETAFGILELSKQNRIIVYPLEMPPGLDICHESVNEVKHILINLS